jgi:hypothetical protein
VLDSPVEVNYQGKHHHKGQSGYHQPDRLAALKGDEESQSACQQYYQPDPKIAAIDLLQLVDLSLEAISMSGEYLLSGFLLTTTHYVPILK